MDVRTCKYIITSNDEADIVSKTELNEVIELPTENDVITLKDVNKQLIIVQKENDKDNVEYLREAETCTKRNQLRNIQLCIICQLNDISAYTST